MPNELFSDYFIALTDSDEREAERVIFSAIDAGSTPEDVIMNVLSPALNEFAQALYDSDITLSQHYVRHKYRNE